MAQLVNEKQLLTDQPNQTKKRKCGYYTLLNVYKFFDAGTDGVKL